MQEANQQGRSRLRHMLHRRIKSPFLVDVLAGLDALTVTLYTVTCVAAS